mmetsp:Transcript_151967/g.487813  ORF Transcript_151967/g.487813 Transcript_151967/m.487813 type:complete len:500 (+) Transcript_151967:3519-5018(+)
MQAVVRHIRHGRRRAAQVQRPTAGEAALQHQRGGDGGRSLGLPLRFQTREGRRREHELQPCWGSSDAFLREHRTQRLQQMPPKGHETALPSLGLRGHGRWPNLFPSETQNLDLCAAGALCTATDDPLQQGHLRDGLDERASGNRSAILTATVGGGVAEPPQLRPRDCCHLGDGSGELGAREVRSIRQPPEVPHGLQHQEYVVHAGGAPLLGPDRVPNNRNVLRFASQRDQNFLGASTSLAALRSPDEQPGQQLRQRRGLPEAVRGTARRHCEEHLLQHEVGRLVERGPQAAPRADRIRQRSHPGPQSRGVRVPRQALRGEVDTQLREVRVDGLQPRGVVQASKQRMDLLHEAKHLGLDRRPRALGGRVLHVGAAQELVEATRRSEAEAHGVQRLRIASGIRQGCRQPRGARHGEGLRHREHDVWQRSEGHGACLELGAQRPSALRFASVRRQELRLREGPGTPQQVPQASGALDAPRRAGAAGRSEGAIHHRPGVAERA